MIIVSSAPLEDRLKLIDTLVFPSNSEFWLRTAVFPGIATAFLIFVYPFPAKWVYEYWHKRQRDLKLVQQRIDDEMPLTQEEAREIRTKAILQQIDFEKQLDAREDQILRLKEVIAKTQLQATEVIKPAALTAQEEVNKLGVRRDPIELDNGQQSLLMKITNAEPLLREDLLAQAKGNPLRLKHDIDKLLQYKLIHTSYPDGEEEYTSTPIGREYLVRHAIE